MIEHIITYNTLLDYLQAHSEDKDNEDRVLQVILSHTGPISWRDDDYIGSNYNLKVQWDDGEITKEPLGLISKAYPVICATYAKEHKLLNQPGWKNLKKYFQNNNSQNRKL